MLKHSSLLGILLNWLKSPFLLLMMVDDGLSFLIQQMTHLMQFLPTSTTFLPRNQYINKKNKTEVH